jgi:MraZ protein
MPEAFLDFHGSFFHTVDSKGRVSLPAKFRSKVGQRVVVTLGFDACAWILPESSWESWMKKIHSMSQLDPKVRKLTRHMVGNAQECEIDRLGRIHISAPIRTYAGIDKDVVIMGMIDAIEVWDKSRLEKSQDRDARGLSGMDILQSIDDAG